MALPTFTAGRRLRASELAALVNAMNAPSVSNADVTGRTTTSTSFTSTLSPANICGVAFTAPQSGKVMLAYSADGIATASGFAASAPAVRTGAVVGAGTSVLAGGFASSVISYVGQEIGAGKTLTLSGLTPGTVYNAYFEHAVGAGTGTFRFRNMEVIPLLA